MAAGSASILLLLQDERFKAGLKSVGSALTSFQAQAEKVATQAKRILLATGGLAGWAVKQQMDQEKAEARLSAVLRATGGAAGYTTEQLSNMAGELQKVTSYADDAVLSMQATLASFTNIRGDTFVRTTKAILDMASALDMDLRSAAMGVGKALDQPAEALAGLSRLGVRFTEGEKKQIEALIAANDFMGAQALVLDKLEQKFKGAAEAVGDTFSGKLSKLKNALSDTGEVLGGIFIPHLERMIAAITQALPGIESWLKLNADSVVEMAAWGAGLLAAAVVLPRIVSGLMAIGKAAAFAVRNNKELLAVMGALAIADIARQVSERVRSEKMLPQAGERAAKSVQDWSKQKRVVVQAEVVAKVTGDTKPLEEALSKLETLATDAARDLRKNAAEATRAVALMDEDLRDETADKLNKEADKLEKNALEAHDARTKLMTASAQVADMHFDIPDTEASKATEEHLKKVEEFIAALKLEAETFGMSQHAAEAYKLSLEGITEAQAEEIRQTEATLVGLDLQQKHREKLQKAAESGANKILELTKELATMAGKESADSLQLIDLENLGVAKEDLEKINALQKARSLILQEQALLQEENDPFQASIEGLLDLQRRVQTSAASSSKDSPIEKLRQTNEQQRLLQNKANEILNSLGIKLEDVKTLLRNIPTSGGSAVYAS